MVMFLQILLSNLTLSLALALLAWIIGTTLKRPRLTFLLWLLALVKLVTPPVYTIPVFLLPSQTSLSNVGAAGVATATTGSNTALLDLILHSAPAVLLLLWVLGSAVVLGMTAVRIHRFNYLLKQDAKKASAEIQEIASRLAARFQLKRVPVIFTTSAHISPLVWWIGGKVRIVLPATLVRQMDSEDFEWVLAHELAHVQRRDHLVRWIEVGAVVCFWWNPIVYWARHNLRIQEELCCDATVISNMNGNPGSYAETLLKALEMISRPVQRIPAIASGLNSGDFLKKRFREIVSGAPKSPTMNKLQTVFVWGLIAALPLGIVGAVFESQVRNSFSNLTGDISEASFVQAETIKALPQAEAAVRSEFAATMSSANEHAATNEEISPSKKIDKATNSIKAANSQGSDYIADTEYKDVVTESAAREVRAVAPQNEKLNNERDHDIRFAGSLASGHVRDTGTPREHPEIEPRRGDISSETGHETIRRGVLQGSKNPNRVAIGAMPNDPGRERIRPPGEGEGEHDRPGRPGGDHPGGGGDHGGNRGGNGGGNDHEGEGPRGGGHEGGGSDHHESDDRFESHTFDKSDRGNEGDRIEDMKFRYREQIDQTDEFDSYRTLEDPREYGKYDYYEDDRYDARDRYDFRDDGRYDIQDYQAYEFDDRMDDRDSQYDRRRSSAGKGSRR